MKKPKAFDINKSVYVLTTVDGENAELTMYGDIYEQRPVDWRTGKPIEGNFILLDEFLADLDQVKGCKSLAIRMNSYGGDAGVSNTIHNRLRELARDGMAISCVVDGVAMSGGSLIMCACDTVRVNPSSLVMIHKAWSFMFGAYNSDELKDAAELMNTWDKMQVEIYKRKTGLSDTVLMHMMSETTYMTGREAKEKGFADELIEDAEPLDIAASADGRSLLVRGRTVRLAAGLFAPDSIPTVTSGAKPPVETNRITPEEDAGKEGGSPMTAEELRAQFPEQVAQVEAEARAAVDHTEAINTAVQAERDRLAGIDEVASLFDPALVKEAKYGDTPCTAAELALKAAQTAAKQGSRFLADADRDADESGASGVPAAPGSDPGKGTENTIEQARADAKAFNESKKEVR